MPAPAPNVPPHRKPYAWRAQLDRWAAFLPWRRRYEHPEGRPGFVLHELGSYLKGTVLDVGAGRSATVFAASLGSRYRPLDIGSSYHIEGRPELVRPETRVDLERDPLPFADEAFDTVVCTDVLEHLDDIHQAYDQLFRVAARHVIISLPNNWVLFAMSLLRGHNLTHSAGYGLGPRPKGVGERHKHWFNFEEAADFLTGRMPEGYRVARFDARFEYGTDSLLCGLRPFALVVRTIEMGRFARYARRDFSGARRWAVLLGGYLAYAVLRPLDVLLSGLVWGVGSRTRFYNLFCRQVWVVFERLPEPGNDG